MHIPQRGAWKKKIPLGREVQFYLQGWQLERLKKRWRPEIILLGVVVSQKGDQGGAEAYIRRALIIQPLNTAYHNSLGRVLLLQGRLEEGLTALRSKI